MAKEKHALVFGASGISGNSLCRQLLQYPSKDTWARVIACSNRPVAKKNAQLPEDPRLELVHGIDLSSELEDVKSKMKEKIKNIEKVTHVFYMAFTNRPDQVRLRTVNVPMFKTAIEAIDTLAPNLEHVILQTGGKAYGVEFADKVEIKPPLKESQPRIPEPYANKIFYYHQTDALQALAKDKKWKWSEIRPDVIVGFVPTTKPMDAAGTLAVYLSLYRHVHGEGAQCPFPGTDPAFRAKHTDTSSYILARFNIHVALNGDKAAGRAFNIADDGEPITWQEKWPKLCEYFGLVAGQAAPYTNPPEEFFDKHIQVWNKLVEDNGLVQKEEPQFWFLDAVFHIDFDRHYDLSASREIGFKETVNTIEEYKKVFEKMRECKYIP